MNPYHQAVSMYQAIGETAEQLRIDMAWHCIHGYVYASPEGFALARPVDSTSSLESILDVNNGFELTNTVDCWHITIAVGNVRHLLSLIPYRLPFISFERRGKFKKYQAERFMK